MCLSMHPGMQSRGRTSAVLLSGAVVGMLAAFVALGVGELGAALLRPEASPVVAVGGAVIDAAPTWAKEFAVREFGTADKPLLAVLRDWL